MEDREDERVYNGAPARQIFLVTNGFDSQLGSRRVKWREQNAIGPASDPSSLTLSVDDATHLYIYPSKITAFRARD